MLSGMLLVLTLTYPAVEWAGISLGYDQEIEQ